MPKTNELTHKQKIFVEKYIETGNGTQAALAAYDTASVDVAKSMASENLAKPNVQEAIREPLVKWEEDSKKRKQLIVDHLAEIAFVGGGDFKGSDRVKATELLARFEGMLTDKQEITHIFPSVYTPQKLAKGYEDETTTDIPM